MGKALGPWSTFRYTTYIQRLLQIYINGTHVKLQTDIRDLFQRDVSVILFNVWILKK